MHHMWKITQNYAYIINSYNKQEALTEVEMWLPPWCDASVVVKYIVWFILDVLYLYVFFWIQYTGRHKH